MIPGGYHRKKNKNKKSRTRRHISSFKNSTNNGRKFISHGGMIAEF